MLSVSLLAFAIIIVRILTEISSNPIVVSSLKEERIKAMIVIINSINRVNFIFLIKSLFLSIINPFNDMFK